MLQPLVIDSPEDLTFQISSVFSDIDIVYGCRNHVSVTCDGIVLFEAIITKFHLSEPRSLLDWVDIYDQQLYDFIAYLIARPKTAAYRHFFSPQRESVYIESAKKIKTPEIHLYVPATEIMWMVLYQMSALGSPVFTKPKPFPEDLYSEKRIERRTRGLKKMWGKGLGLQYPLGPYLWTPRFG